MRATARRSAQLADRFVRIPLRLQRLRLQPVLVLALGAGATAGAVLFQFLILPRPTLAPFVFFFLAVAVVGWLSGTAAGLTTAVLSAGAASWLFLPPVGRLALSSEAFRATVAFLVVACSIALLCGALRQRLVAARGAAEQLEEQAALLRRSAAAAREAEERFRTLSDALPQLVWMALPDGSVEYYNSRSAQYAGLVQGPGGLWTWRPAVHPEDQERTLAAWNEALATGRVYEIEHRVQMADGSYRWHLSRGVPMRDEAGRVTRWYGTATDVHEQRRAAEALAESDRRKSEFLGVLSHELRNPLAPIRNSLHVAARSAPGSEPHRRALAVIERQVAQLHRLVDDLLDVTRITRGKIHLERTRVDLAQLARQVVEDHREQFQRSGVELVLDSAGEVPVLADAARLAQVIGNLLQNAAKFSPRGGRTTLTVRSAGERVAELVIEDTGRGIAPEVLGRLFEPFVQAEQSLDRSMGGLGLGLALVKGLVELHGGAVRAESGGAGCGARFTVTLPRERRRTPRLQLVTAPGAGTSPRRVLIVEDNPDAAETLKEALELDGHEVEVAFTGVDGVERARALRPDAIVCDIGLPGLNGFEVARALRADPRLASTTLIALSGYALAEDVERARAAGFDRHLAKPPDLEELERSIGAGRG